MDLISFCWDLGCKLPKDEAALQKLADLSDEDWEENQEAILNQFVDHPDDPDGLTHPKLLDLWKKAGEFSEKQREKSKKAVAKRRRGKGTTQGNPKCNSGKPRGLSQTLPTGHPRVTHGSPAGHPSTSTSMYKYHVFGT